MDYNWYYNEKLIKKKSLKKIFFITLFFSCVIPFILGFNPFVSKDYHETILSSFAQNVQDLTGLEFHEIAFAIILYFDLILLSFFVTFFIIFILI